MTANPRPILCDTDSEIQNTTDSNTDQIFKHNEPFESIPDFTDSNDNKNVSFPKNEGKQKLINRKQSEKNIVDEMIHNFDQQNNYQDNDNNDNDTNNMVEYITKNKFSSLIGEMRVDILSLVNLIGVLNKNMTLNNEEIQNLKKEVNKLVTENIFLKEKVVRLKDDQINMRDAYDETLFSSCEKKVIKKDDRGSKQIEEIENNENNENNEKNEKNEFNDALMEKRANRFKVVPVRTRTGNDMFGTHVETKEELPLSNTTRQIMRKETVDNTLKKAKNSSQIRGARMGLLSDSDQMLTSSQPAIKNSKTNQKQSTIRVSTRKK